ncbi:MAG: alanine--tRNA ligase [Bacilli bacterium]|nr:alanine--tRNA ligase [Bacilli bacterium]
MKKFTHMEIRKMWLSFFESKDHKIIESAPLLPINDDSLLFINAGVTPLKKYFDGSVVPENKRLTNIQKCIRTNDIENVGVTKRHLTFFEMMGNFSIGDYFKDEAISYAMELLTSPEYFNVDKNLLYVTIYTDDDYSYDKWIEVGMDEDHIVRLEDNFWEIGEGPCGPDSEIFYDRGEKYDPDHNALELFKCGEDQERFVEIWNNVFSQYNSKKGEKREDYKELPNKNIDTGAGFERWCTIFQDKDSMFETDLFEIPIRHLEQLSGIKYSGQTPFKVIVDHLRAITFALSDGIYFDNAGRGYVLRRLLRRSVRMGKMLNINKPFIYKMVSDVVETFGEVYPNLVEKQGEIAALVLEEEKLFLNTLDAGLKILRNLTANSNDGFISGADAFKLYDTYGFPFELTKEYLNEMGFSVSEEEFNKYMDIQKELAKKNAKTKTQMASQKKVLLDFKEPSEFVYGIYRLKSKVIGIFSKDSLEKELTRGGYIALDRTCFYSEAGGQVSDTGIITGQNFKARVLDVFKGPNGQHIHKVKLLDGKIKQGDTCELILDKERRKAIEANHSSVHLLHYALRSKISENIHQAGSYLDQDRLRLDFTYTGKLTDDMIKTVEERVNESINNKLIVSTEVLPIEKAKQLGAMALFNEKYGDIVRVVKMGKSMEFCAGTHVSNTKDIKEFAITSYESKGSNVYRIEAVTADKIESALTEITKPYHDEIIKLLMKAKSIIDAAEKEGLSLNFDVDIENPRPTSYKDVIFIKNELAYIQNEVKMLEKRYNIEKEKATLSNLDEYEKLVKQYDDVFTIVTRVDNKDVNMLKVVADALINELGKAFVFFANVKDNKTVNFICRSSCDISAGIIVKDSAVTTNGNGGGSNTFAQGGGNNIDKLDEVFAHIEDVLNGKDYM